MTVDRILKGHDLFQSLNVDDAHRVSQFSAVKTYDANESVFKFNEAANHVYMLMEGSVDLRLPANPPDFSFVISRIEKGELFGLSPLLDSERYTGFAFGLGVDRVAMLRYEGISSIKLFYENDPRFLESFRR